MPMWFRVLVSSFLVLFMIALSASVEAEAAPVEFDGRGFASLDSSPDTFWFLDNNVSLYGTASPDISDFYAFCYSRSSSSKYVTFVYCPRDGKIDPDTVYSSFILSGSSAFPDVSISPISPYSSNFVAASSYSSFSLDPSYDRYLYDISVNPSSVVAQGMYVYSDWNDGLKDVVDYVSSLPSVDPSPLKYTLPSGYALVLDISGLDRVAWSADTTVPPAINPYGSLISYVSSDLPIDGSVLPSSYSSFVAYGRTDIFGRYSQYRTGNPVTGNYLILANVPWLDKTNVLEFADAWALLQSLDTTDFMINVTAIKPPDSYLIPVTSEVNRALFPTVSFTHRFGTSRYYFAPPAEGSPTDTPVTTPEVSPGEPFIPVPGGGTAPTTPNTYNWLENIANQLSNFFGGAIGAINTLTSSASQFFTWIGSFFSWLPDEVYSVLISGLILAIIIGVMKHLL